MDMRNEDIRELRVKFKSKDETELDTYLGWLYANRTKQHVSEVINSKNGVTKATLLHSAVENSSTTKAKTLITYGANVLEKRENGDTPLHIASYIGREDMVEVLLESKHGVRSICFEEGHGQICECGLKAMFEVNIKGKRPIDEARFGNSKASMKLTEDEILYQAEKGKNPKEMCLLIGSKAEKVDVSERFYDRLMAVCILNKYISLIAFIVLKLAKDIERIKYFVTMAYEKKRRSKIPFFLLLMCYEMLLGNDEFVKLDGRYFESMNYEIEYRDNREDYDDEGDDSDEDEDDSDEFRAYFTKDVIELILTVTAGCNDMVRMILLKKLHNDNRNQTDWSCLELNKIQKDWLVQISTTSLLNLSRNNLTSFPRLFDSNQNYLEALTKLDLSHNRIKKIHADLFKLKYLRVVDLSHNLLKMLPLVTFCDSLTELYLNNNELCSLPKSIGSSCIGHLDLKYNKFESLPLCVCDMPMLRNLILDGNDRILQFPNEMGRMRSDLYISLKNMDQLHYPPSLCESNRHNQQHKLVLYHRQKLYETKQNDKMNLLVIGPMRHGKSLLVKRLLKKTDILNPPSTIGIKVGEVLNFKSWWKSFHLQIVDFAGEIEYSTNQCFFTNRSLYLLVWNVKEKKDTLQEWLNCLVTYVPNAHVMIAGTCADQVNDTQATLKADLIDWIKWQTRFVTLRFGARKSNVGKKESHFGKYWFSLVSNSIPCNRAFAIKEFRKRLQFVAKSIRNPVNEEPILGERLPAFYFSLADKIKETKETSKIIHSDQMLEMMYDAQAKQSCFHYTDCKKIQNVSLATDLRDLADVVQYMHDTGTLLHFKRNADLQQVYFADIDSIRTVLLKLSEGGLGEKKDGKIGVDEVKKILGADYASYALDHFLQMFHMGFNTSSRTVQLVHSMANERPTLSGVTSFRNPQINRRLHTFGYIPFGFWVKLISRIMLYLDRYLVGSEDLVYYDRPPTSDLRKLLFENVHYWKYGIIFDDPDNNIFLEVSQYDEKHSEILGCPEFTRKTVIESKVITDNAELSSRLITSVVDDIRTLIIEWHKSLTDVNESAVLQFSPCYTCLEGRVNPPKLFRLDDCLEKFLSTGHESMLCDRHMFHNQIRVATLYPEFLFRGHSRLIIKPCHQLHYTMNEDAPFGGFGKVYKGTLKSHAGDCYGNSNVYEVAVKQLKFKLEDIGFVDKFQEFRQEVLLLNHVSVHPNIISLYGVKLGQQLEIIMEHAPHGSLSDRLDDDQDRLDRLLLYRVSYQIADALKFFHNCGILHRDLKPANIVLFTEDPRVDINVKIIDFGTANYMNPVGMALLAGTTRYMAPELLIGKSDYTQAVDIWCFSFVLYEMLTGKIPFKGVDNKDIGEYLKLEYRPKLTEEHTDIHCLKSLMEKCWHSSPVQRPSAREILIALESTCFQLLMDTYQDVSINEDNAQTACFKSSLLACELTYVMDRRLFSLNTQHMRSKELVNFQGFQSVNADGSMNDAEFYDMRNILAFSYIDVNHVAIITGLHDEVSFNLIIMKLAIALTNQNEDMDTYVISNQEIVKITDSRRDSSFKRFKKLLCNTHSVFLFYDYSTCIRNHGSKTKVITKQVLKEYYQFESGKFDPHSVEVSDKVSRECIDINLVDDVLIVAYQHCIKLYKTLNPGLGMECLKEISNGVGNLLHCKNYVLVSHKNGSAFTCFSYEEHAQSVSILEEYNYPLSSSRDEWVCSFIAVNDTLWIGTSLGHIIIFAVSSDKKSLIELKRFRPYTSHVKHLLLNQDTNQSYVISYGTVLNERAFSDGKNTPMFQFNRKFLKQNDVHFESCDSSDLLLFWHASHCANFERYPTGVDVSGRGQMTDVIRDLISDCT